MEIRHVKHKTSVHQISKASPMKQRQVLCVSSHISGGCVVVDQQCRESNGKAKIEGYMRVSDEEAHHCAC